MNNQPGTEDKPDLPAVHAITVPIRRPVATSMWFIAVSMLGIFAWLKLPVELFPALTGQKLYVEFYRPSAEAEVIEREILQPLESRVRGLTGVTRTRAEIKGPIGNYTVEFAPFSNILVRELELRNIAAQINRQQPVGSQIEVTTESTRDFSRFVMVIQVIGGNDVNALRQFAEEQLQPKIAAVNGVSRVQITGGAPRQLSVWIDAKRTTELGLTPNQVTAALARSVQRMQTLGQTQNGNRHYEVVLAGQPDGIVSLRDTQIVPDKPVLLRHVAEIKLDTAEPDSVFRVNGKPTVGVVVFQNENNNLIKLGQNLRHKLDELGGEFNQFGIEFVIGFDGSDLVGEQLDKLKGLAVSGFLVALAVLFLFMKDYRALAIVSIAVPVSLLAAGVMLYLSGNSLNLLTLCGLAISVGMLVDNSIVVYEAIQRCLERGLTPLSASVEGIRRTIRAMLASNATNAAVFLPVLFLVDDAVITTVVKIVSAAILLPLFASLLVAVFLVPLLAHKLAAPAAMQQIELKRRLKQHQDNIVAPALMKNLSTAVLKVFLRRPVPWVTTILLVIVVTVAVLLPWVIVNSFSDSSVKADQVKMEIEFTRLHSLEVSGTVFDRLETALDTLPGILRIESHFQETQGSITVFLNTAAPDASSPAKVDAAISAAVAGISGVKLRRLSNVNTGAEQSDPYDRSGDLFENSAAFISVSGPDMNKIQQIAEEIEQRLLSIRYVESAYVATRQQPEELQIKPDINALTAYGVTSSQLLSLLQASGREGIHLPVAYVLHDGNEVPVVIRHVQPPEHRAVNLTDQLALSTEFGTLPMSELAQSRLAAPQPAITYFNGRREIFIEYKLKPEFAQLAGPAREQVEKEISRLIETSHRPEGYAIEAIETKQAIAWLNITILPVLILLYALLAITFESFTLPLLVLLALPLTFIGAVWALFITGQGGGIMSVIGVIVLLGLTINPAILLIDRMQQRAREGKCAPGGAALASVRERVRPILMTSCTTVAGLWPLALSSGSEFELWPPFAIVVIGGLITSTLLTLVVIPVGFVGLTHLERLAKKLGIKIIGLIGLAVLIIVLPLILTGLLSTLVNQVFVILSLAMVFFWLAVKLWLKPVPVTIDHKNITITVKYLSKVYGKAGPVRQAINRHKQFSLKYPDIKAADAKERMIVWVLLLMGSLYLALEIDVLLWKLCFFYITAALFTFSIKEFRTILLRQQKQTPPEQQPAATQVPKALSQPPMLARINTLTPWMLLLLLGYFYTLLPVLRQQSPDIPLVVWILLAIVTSLVQFARQAARKAIEAKSVSAGGHGIRARITTTFRRISLQLFGFGIDELEVSVLSSIHFAANTGMIGIMGPNGAGKTTLMRILSGIMPPTTGTVHYANVENRKLADQRQELIGYLPQSFGLPDHLTAREYLEYYAIAYKVGDQGARQQRLDTLLNEVGLAQRQHEKIKEFSGGMRQRVAIARTLLREPPIIIVDEPTVGLDPKERIRFRNLLARLAKERIVLFSTHVVEDVAVSCERVLVLKRGRLIYDDNPHNLAKLADKMVWELKLPELAAQAFMAKHKVIDQVPEFGGLIRLRVLAQHQPHPEARSVEASLEDGYFQLFQES